jgi:hypothetical protein
MKFPQEFVFFMELMTEFSFPGDILNVVTSGRTNGNDTIAFTYDFERSNGVWPPDLIPFYAVGNGDYFCFRSSEGASSHIYYIYHEDGRVEKHSESFEVWVKELPKFLGTS